MHVAVTSALIAPIGTVIADTNTLVADTSDGYYCCDVQDGLFTFNVYQRHEKLWVARLVIPYMVVFGVACVISLFTMVQKGKLIAEKFRRRRAAQNALNHAAAGGREETLTFEESLDANKMAIQKAYCVLLLGATEGAQCDFRLFDAKTKVMLPHNSS